MGGAQTRHRRPSHGHRRRPLSRPLLVLLDPGRVRREVLAGPSALRDPERAGPVSGVSGRSVAGADVGVDAQGTRRIVRATRTEPLRPDKVLAPGPPSTSRPIRAAAASPSSPSGMTRAGGGCSTWSANGLANRRTRVRSRRAPQSGRHRERPPLVRRVHPQLAVFVALGRLRDGDQGAVRRGRCRQRCAPRPQDHARVAGRDDPRVRMHHHRSVPAGPVHVPSSPSVLLAATAGGSTAIGDSDEVATSLDLRNG